MLKRKKPILAGVWRKGEHIPWVIRSWLLIISLFSLPPPLGHISTGLVIRTLSGLLLGCCFPLQDHWLSVPCGWDAPYILARSQYLTLSRAVALSSNGTPQKGFSRARPNCPIKAFPLPPQPPIKLHSFSCPTLIN